MNDEVKAKTCLVYVWWWLSMDEESKVQPDHTRPDGMNVRSRVTGRASRGLLAAPLGWSARVLLPANGLRMSPVRRDLAHFSECPGPGRAGALAERSGNIRVIVG